MELRVGSTATPCSGVPLKRGFANKMTIGRVHSIAPKSPKPTLSQTTPPCQDYLLGQIVLQEPPMRRPEARTDACKLATPRLLRGLCPPGSKNNNAVCSCNAGYYGDGMTCKPCNKCAPNATRLAACIYLGTTCKPDEQSQAQWRPGRRALRGDCNGRAGPPPPASPGQYQKPRMAARATRRADSDTP